MVDIEELKQNFVTRNVAPYGSCIAIPNKDFNSAWEKELQSQGVKVFNTFIGNAPFVLVQLKPMKTAAPVINPNLDVTRHWTEEEDARLIKLWNEDLGIAAITPFFPNRSEHGVKMRLSRLKEAGKIHPRWTRKKRKARSKAPEPPTPTTPTAPPTATTPTEAPSQKGPGGIPESDYCQMIKLLKEIHDLLKEESVYFESYCPECRDRRTVEDSNTWKCCPVCGGPLIIWNVEAKETSK
jgi:hypothetical protein